MNPNKLSETEIIVKMREAIEVLKEKWQESEGVWGMVDFISAATDKSHWMHVVTEAEKLSDPYLKKGTPFGGGA